MVKVFKYLVIQQDQQKLTLKEHIKRDPKYAQILNLSRMLGKNEYISY